jgi:NAD(P)-dependent dehydrogenase (short-subunit alcohol dehydrogenase family)
MTGPSWNTADVPDQTGRTAIVTGGNTGLGFHVARVLADHGARVVIACRDTRKGADAAAAMKSAEVVRLDLASLASVRKAAPSTRSSRSRPRWGRCRSSVRRPIPVRTAGNTTGRGT